MTLQTRKAVEAKYAISGDDYDRIRLENPRGRLLSEHDLQLFDELFPELDETSTVLEVGAGTGRFTIPALRRGVRLTATDINETLLDSLRRKVHEENFDGQCDIGKENAFDLTFADNTFDLVFTFHMIPRLTTTEDQRAAITEIARVVKPGGLLFFNYRNCRSFYRVVHRGHLTSPRDMKDILRDADLEIVKQRGKWLLNRRLIDALPLFAGRAAAAVDWSLRRILPTFAWDIFVLARKRSDS